jgi:hypothetical protein
MKGGNEYFFSFNEAIQPSCKQSKQFDIVLGFEQDNISIGIYN